VIDGIKALKLAPEMEAGIFSGNFKSLIGERP
jgi:hypothetical protein